MFDLGSAVGYLLLDISGFQKGFKEANSQMKTFLDKTSTFSDKVDTIRKTMESVGGTLTKYVTTPLIGTGTAIVAFANDSQSAMNKFQAKVGDVTRDVDDYKNVMESIYKNNYGEDFDDIADSMANVVSIMGELDDVELQNVTESAFALRDTFEYDVSESIRAADALMKNFGLTSEEAFDFIAKGAQDGLDFSGEFIDSINEYSVQFKKLGFTAEETFQIYKKGAESGAWNLDKIGDAIKELSVRAIDGSETTTKGFNLIGLSADEMAQKFAAGGESAREAFDQVIAGLDDMDDPVQQSIAGVNLFGTMWEDLGPDVITQLQDITSGAVDMKGAMDQIKDVRYDNLGSAIEGLRRSLKVAGSELGETLIPKVEAAIDFIDGLVEKFSELSPETKEMIVNVGLVAAALGPLLLIGGKILSFVSTVGPMLSGAGITISSLVTPIGIVVAAIAALAAAWATNFGGIRDTAYSVMTSVQEIISTVLGIITTLWNENFLGIRDIAMTVFESIELVVSTVLDTIALIFDTFSKAFQGDWEGVWENVKAIFSGIWDAIVTLLSNFLNIIVDTIIRIGVMLLSAAKNAFNNIMNGFTEVWNSIVEWFEKAIEDPVGTVKSIGTALFDAGKSIFTSLWDGLKNVWDSIVGWVEDAISWIVSKVKFWEDESTKVDTGGNFSGSGSGRIGGSYASGLDYVPRDMIVKVHEGESIRTKQQTKMDNMNDDGGVPEQMVINLVLDDEVLETKIVDMVKKEVRT